MNRASQFLLTLLLAVMAGIAGFFIYQNPVGLAGIFEELRGEFGGPWKFPVDAAMGLVTVVAMWFSAAGIGLWALYRSGAADHFPSAWQRLIFGLLIGWVFLATATLMLGLAGFCNRVALGALLLATAIRGISGWTSYWQYLVRQVEADPTASEFRNSRWITTVMVLLYLITVPYAVTPSVESDELRYHLAVPEAYLESGSIEYLPHQAFSNFPFMIEMLFTMAMALQGPEGAKLVHLAFLEHCAVLIALLSFLMLRLSLGKGREISAFGARTVSGLAGAAFASVPTATVLACWGFVDIATVAYLLALVYLGALILVKPRRPPAWLVGVIVAGGIGTKYLMIPLVLVLALYLTALLITTKDRRRKPRRGVVRYLVTVAVVAAALVSPWLIKSAIWTGNPVYPLAYGVFGGGDWSVENAEFYAAKAGEKGFKLAETQLRYDPESEGPRTALDWIDSRGLPVSFLFGRGGTAAELAVSPITTSLFPGAFENHYLGSLPLIAICLALGGLVLLRGSRFNVAQGWCYGAIGIGWIYWFFTYQSNRMLLPTFALIFAMAGWSAGLVVARCDRLDRMRHHVVALGVIVAMGFFHSLAFSFQVIHASKFRGHPLPVALGFKSETEYLEGAVNYYRAAQWLGTKVGPESKALLIGEHRTMYFPNDIIVSDWFDTPQPLPLLRETEDKEDEEALFERLEQEKVRYVFLNTDELSKYAARYFKPRFSPEEYARFTSFVTDGRLREVYRDPDRLIQVFEIAEK